jgi:hypothetical protein
VLEAVVPVPVGTSVFASLETSPAKQCFFRYRGSFTVDGQSRCVRRSNPRETAGDLFPAFHADKFRTASLGRVQSPRDVLRKPIQPKGSRVAIGPKSRA